MSEAKTEILPFEPKYMNIGILTAALQDLTSRDIRNQDPDRAIEEWVEYASTIGAKHIQLSTALHPEDADVPPDAMLDPVADHLSLREPFDAKRAERVATVLKKYGVRISDLGYFDNFLTPDKAARELKHTTMKRAIDAAVLLDVPAVSTFVGRDPTKDMDQNLAIFEQVYIPLLKYAKDRKKKLRIEQCPMPGWNIFDTWLNNLAYTPAMWIKLYEIADKHDVGDEFRITYDESHAILMGQKARDNFQYLKDEGHEFLIDAFHGKGQQIDAKELSAWGYQGQSCGRGDRQDGKAISYKDLVKAWLKMGYACHELVGSAVIDRIAQIQNRTADWEDHQYAAREILKLGKDTDFTVEHEFGPARIQDKERLTPILQGAISFMTNMDKVAADRYAMHQVLSAQGIKPQGVGIQPYRA